MVSFGALAEKFLLFKWESKLFLQKFKRKQFSQYSDLSEDIFKFI